RVVGRGRGRGGPPAGGGPLVRGGVGVAGGGRRGGVAWRPRRGGGRLHARGAGWRAGTEAPPARMGDPPVLRTALRVLVRPRASEPARTAGRARLGQWRRRLGRAQRAGGPLGAGATADMADRLKVGPRRTVAAAAPHLERLLWRVGIRHVAGVDEVGMGPLAGPVVAAAVVLPGETHIPGVADSTVLAAGVREKLCAEVRRRAIAVGVAVVEPVEIDRVNIYQAGLLALRRAVEQLRPLVPGFVLVDGREIPDLGIPQS